MQVFPTLAEEINGVMHVRVKMGDPQVGYALSLAAFHVLPRDMIIKRLSKELSELLHTNLSEAGL
jgi:hypothetical protein